MGSIKITMTQFRQTIEAIKIDSAASFTALCQSSSRQTNKKKIHRTLFYPPFPTFFFSFFFSIFFFNFFPWR